MTYTSVVAKNGQTYHYRDGRRIKAADALGMEKKALTYEDLLKEARDSLKNYRKHEKLEAKAKFVAESECDNCLGRESGNKACSGPCFMALRRHVATGIEPHLKGKWLKKMIDLNHYILTTASANWPDDPTFSNLGLTFFLPPEDAKALVKWLSKTKEYQYLICESKSSGCKIYAPRKSQFMKDHKGRNGAFYWSAEAPTQLYKRYKHIPLSYMTIEDPVQSRRDLYDVLLRYFRARAR